MRPNSQIARLGEDDCLDGDEPLTISNCGLVIPIIDSAR